MAEVEDLAQKWRRVGLPNDIVAQMVDMLVDGQEESQVFAWGFAEFKARESPAAKLQTRIDDIKSGKVAVVHWPWKQLTHYAPALTPGTVTVLAGAPGAGKSFLVMQCLSAWLRLGVSCSVLALESTREEHLQRLLAQLESDSNLVDLDWIKANPLLSDAAMKRNFDWVDEVGRRVVSLNMDEVTYFDVLEFVRQRGQKGDKVVTIDPITAADGQGQPWKVDKKLVYQAYRLAKQYRLSVIFVSHPTKDFLEPSLAHLAGGAAYSRHGECAIWIEKLEAKTHSVKGCCGPFTTDLNRIFHLLKVKHGMGQGMRIGYKFCPDSLLFAEQGIIVKREKE